MNSDWSHPANGFFNKVERQYHITILELLVVHYAVLSYLPQIQGAKLHLHEDNMGLVYILRERTSKSLAIMRLLRRLSRRVGWGPSGGCSGVVEDVALPAGDVGASHRPEVAGGRGGMGRLRR